MEIRIVLESALYVVLYVNKFVSNVHALLLLDCLKYVSSSEVDSGVGEERGKGTNGQ